MARLPAHLDPIHGIVAQEPITGRWFITMGHAGFNSDTNNGEGYASERSALSAHRLYDARGPRPTPTTHLNGPASGSVGKTAYVNGVPHIVLEAVTDRHGELLAISRPKGQRVYLARWCASDPHIYGEDRAAIIASLGWR